MTASSKGSSRWGSFLQQAVAGVESRLDTILAEGDEAPKSKPTTPTGSNNSAKAENGLSRTGSTASKTNDRLQERLAKAMAAKNAAQRNGSQTPISGAPSRTASPATEPLSPRQSVDSTRQSIEVTTPKTDDFPFEAEPEVRKSEERDLSHIFFGTKDHTETPNIEDGARVSIEAPRVSIESRRESRPSSDLPSETAQPAKEPPPSISITTSEATEANLKQLQEDFETAQLQRQEEVHSYVEQIDALQAKLQYLSKESAEAARKTISSAPAGSIEKKLAEKEEQIALLMEEGQKWSKTELKHMTAIKTLRAKILNDSKDLQEANRKQEKAKKEVLNLSACLRQAELAQKNLNERLKSTNKLQKDFDAMKADRDAKDATIKQLKQQLNEAKQSANEAETKSAMEALAAEREKLEVLEEKLSDLRLEKELSNDRAQAQIKELKEQAEKDSQRRQAAEIEMKAEQQMLESKLEVMRARAEEVSSGATGDAQAKLLRQIETLQSQYAVASENWQGIESSMISRIASLEKERDDLTKKEADIRRKAREVTLKSKRNEEELEDTQAKLQSFQHDLTEHKSKLDELQLRAEEAETALLEAKSSFEQEKQALKAEAQQQLDEERQRLQEHSNNSVFSGRGDSPAASSQRGLTSDLLGLQNLQSRRQSARSTTGELPVIDRLVTSRRPSVLPRGSHPGTPQRQDSNLSSTHTNGERPTTPSVHMDHDDDFFEGPESPQQNFNDMVSVSTVGAGPSVELVGRMSAAVRRLESEKVATKEDIARLSSQRDEARSEIVNLMQEVSAKREADEKVKKLEEEVQALKERYDTTLEMLGAKTEEAEELRADVADVKEMYKELVDRVMAK